MKGRPGPTTALGGSNPLKLLILYNESKHNILAYQDKANKGMCHDLAIYITKHLNAKEELGRIPIFHHAKIIIFKTKSSERNQNSSRYHNSLYN
jgi:hypothetical protein